MQKALKEEGLTIKTDISVKSNKTSVSDKNSNSLAKNLKISMNFQMIQSY